jgi:invasion protein IalB
MTLRACLAAALALPLVTVGLATAPIAHAKPEAREEKGKKPKAAAPAVAAPAAAATAPVAAASPAAPTAPAGPAIAREKFGEWELECFEPKVNGLACQIVQKLVATDSNQLVLVVSIAFDPASKKHLLQVALPLNFLLKPGVEIAIGEAKTVAHVDRCSAQGCFIEGIAGDDLVAAMAAGAKGDV